MASNATYAGRERVRRPKRRAPGELEGTSSQGGEPNAQKGRTVHARPMHRCVARSSTQGGGAEGQGVPSIVSLELPGSFPAGGAKDDRGSPRSPGAGVRLVNDIGPLTKPGSVLPRRARRKIVCQVSSTPECNTSSTLFE